METIRLDARFTLKSVGTSRIFLMKKSYSAKVDHQIYRPPSKNWSMS